MEKWSAEEDKIVIDTVLEYIRTAKVQWDAFNAVAIEIGRTPSAVGYRWNGVLRKTVQCEIEQAKQERLKIMTSRQIERMTTSNERQDSMWRKLRQMEKQMDVVMKRLDKMEMELI